MKKGIYILLILILFTACSKSVPIEEQNSMVKKEKQAILDIMVTNKFLYNITRNIVKDKHSVDYMFKDLSGQWNFSFTEDSLNNISKQNLFLYMGVGLEPWIPDFLEKLNKSKVGVINVSRGVKLMALTKEIKYKETTLKENPYYWMGIDNYKITILNVKNAIEDKDPENRSFYEDNFNECIKELDDFQKEYKILQDRVKECTFIVRGDELDYYLKYSGFKTLKLVKEENLSPQGEIESNDKLDKKIKEIKNPIFIYEEGKRPQISEELVRKYNIKQVEIKIYTGDMKYIDLLKYNANNLKKII